MEPLKEVRRIMTLLCVYPSDENSGIMIKLGCVVFALAILAGNIAGMAAGTVYFFKSGPSERENSMYTLCLVSGLMSMTLTMIIAFFQRREITATIDHLLRIHDECK